LFQFFAHGIQGNLQGLFTQFARFILQLLPKDKTPQHSKVNGGWQLGKVY
jgi:hypothetical protein